MAKRKDLRQDFYAKMKNFDKAINRERIKNSKEYKKKNKEEVEEVEIK